MSIFINFTNHTSKKWGEKQLEAAKKYGEIIDVKFPSVSPDYTEEQIDELADEYFDKILKYNPSIVLCQGEFCMTYIIVRKFQEKGIKVLAACSKRCTIETINKDNKTNRTSQFDFIKFREYRN